MARFPKGSFSLHPIRDIEILRQVHRCGFVTSSQLFRFLKLEGTETEPKATADRVRRLVKFGYLGFTFDPQYPGKKIYFCTEPCDDVLSRMGEPLPCRLPQDANRSRVEQTTVVHWTDLAELKLALKEKNILKRWIPEPEVRSLNDLTPYRFAKEYDAVVELEAKPSLRIGIEYERVRKTKSRYDEICGVLEDEQRVHFLLYITTSINLLTFLHERFSQAGFPVAITLYSDLRKKLLDAPVWEAKSFDGRIPFHQYLSMIEARRAQKTS